MADFVFKNQSRALIHYLEHMFVGQDKERLEVV